MQIPEQDLAMRGLTLQQSQAMQPSAERLDSALCAAQESGHLGRSSPPASGSTWARVPHSAWASTSSSRSLEHDARVCGGRSPARNGSITAWASGWRIWAAGLIGPALLVREEARVDNERRNRPRCLGSPPSSEAQDSGGASCRKLDGVALRSGPQERAIRAWWAETRGWIVAACVVLTARTGPPQNSRIPSTAG